MDKYLQKMQSAEDEVAGEILDDRLAEHAMDGTHKAAILLGRAQAADRIAVALSAEVIRFLEYFEQTKLYRSLGHPDFVTFLRNSGLNAVTKNRYYDRKKLLDKEGDPVFDALTIAGVPISVRSQLEAGDVAVDGDSIVIRGENEDDIIIHKDDHSALIQALRIQARTRRTAANELAALKDKVKAAEKKHDAEKRELYDELDRARASAQSDLMADPHSLALTNVCLAFQALRNEAETLSAVDREARAANVMETLAYQMRVTAGLYGAGEWTRYSRPANGASGGTDADDEFDWDSRIDDALAGIENDSELAEQL